MLSTLYQFAYRLMQLSYLYLSNFSVQLTGEIYNKLKNGLSLLPGIVESLSVYSVCSCGLQKFVVVIPRQPKIPLCGVVSYLHGLINQRNQSKMSSKKLTYKGTCRQMFFRVYRLEIQSGMLVRPSFVNCCSSNFLSGTTLPLSSLPCVNRYTVYTYTVCKGGGVWCYGPQTDKHLPQNPFTGQPF
jgi:hypothetical protein